LTARRWWSDRQLRRHLQRLVELEYVLPYRTGQRNGREYALLYDGQGREGETFLLGLLDASKLRQRQTGGQKSQSAPTPAGDRRPTGGTSASPKNGASRSRKKTSAPTKRKTVKK